VSRHDLDRLPIDQANQIGLAADRGSQVELAKMMLSMERAREWRVRLASASRKVDRQISFLGYCEVDRWAAEPTQGGSKSQNVGAQSQEYLLKTS
jgi:hypothetical protein